MPIPTRSAPDPPAGREPGSFRDPGGFLYRRNGVLYRQVNAPSEGDYAALIDSGLYGRLTNDGLLIEHSETDRANAYSDEAVRVLEPTLLKAISYPYEWSFSQLKDAALTTLRIQACALEHGMSLKDASAYNIQFHRGRPILIDTLSFERYREGRPWVAYRQFCQHFLAPLALMANVDVRLNSLLRSHIDGLPLDLTSRALPASTRWRWSLLTHIHLHAKAQSRVAAGSGQTQNADGQVSLNAFRGLIDSLQSAVENLRWTPKMGVWGDYYDNTNYSDESFAHKVELVSKFLSAAQPQTVWDLGANNGRFSRIAAQQGAHVLSMDCEPAAVEANYRQCRDHNEERILPLLMDLTNPSPNLGWGGAERADLIGRGSADLILALALVHHLAIGNNVPLDDIARYFARLGSQLLIEFVPKQDSQVRRMLSTREDVFPYYTIEGFEAAFSEHYETVKRSPVPGTERVLYLMRRVQAP